MYLLRLPVFLIVLLASCSDNSEYRELPYSFCKARIALHRMFDLRETWYLDSNRIIDVYFDSTGTRKTSRQAELPRATADSLKHPLMLYANITERQQNLWAAGSHYVFLKLDTTVHYDTTLARDPEFLQTYFRYSNIIHFTASAEFSLTEVEKDGKRFLKFSKRIGEREWTCYAGMLANGYWGVFDFIPPSKEWEEIFSEMWQRTRFD